LPLFLGAIAVISGSYCRYFWTLSPSFWSYPPFFLGPIAPLGAIAVAARGMADTIGQGASGLALLSVHLPPVHVGSPQPIARKAAGYAGIWC
jgi:hypothetical protein